jgi:hypothetical protein
MREVLPSAGEEIAAADVKRNTGEPVVLAWVVTMVLSWY